jgi:phosphoserine phosphatase
MSDKIIIHVSGRDRPGITSAISEIIHNEKAKMVDIGQSVLHGFLILSAIVEIPSGSDALKKLLFKVADLGLRLEVSTFSEDLNRPSRRERQKGLRLSLLGDLSDGRAFSDTSKFLASRLINIRSIRTLSRSHFNGLELIVDLPGQNIATESELQSIRGEILELSQQTNCDVAVQKDDVFRRHKRIVCMDVDSTFVQMEVIDELARLAGCKAKVAAITERAMNGELDFKSALSERVMCLKGLSFSKAQELLNDIPLSKGVVEFVAAIKKLGFSISLVSGGFDFFVNELKNRYSLDFAFANTLEVIDGKITGKLLGSIVDSERKAQILKDLSQLLKCNINQTVAIGDGANDIEMLRTAGLGIAFRAKEVTQKAAHFSLNNSTMEKLCLLMGFDAEEMQDL